MKAKKYRKGNRIPAERVFYHFKFGNPVFIRDDIYSPDALGNLTVKALLSCDKKGHLFAALEERREKGA